MVKVGIIGATGYTGVELIKILRHHPGAQVVWMTSESSAGQKMDQVFSLPPIYDAMPLVSAAQADLAAADVIFCCLPHAASQVQVAAARSAGARVVDLSADFRLHDAALYEQWYAVPHNQRALLTQAVYGLPELHRNEIAASSLVANPGCYPTTVILGLAPLARRGWLEGTVIADSKSGVSGAGRKPSQKSHFVEANENLSPYSIGRSHRHLAEMEQELGLLAGDVPLSVIFSPHLVPVSRGMVSTIYVTLPEAASAEVVRQSYVQDYAAEPFVHVLPSGDVATMAHSVNSNFCVIGLTPVAGTRILIVTSSVDNLVKGASGQAVQNMNVMFGLEETTGLL